MLMVYEKRENYVALIQVFASWAEFEDWREEWQRANPAHELLVAESVHFKPDGSSRMATPQ